MSKFITLFDRHKLYRAFPKSQSDVDYLDKLLKQGDDGVSKNKLDIQLRALHSIISLAPEYFDNR